jgi:tripartite-type tricarboxylate transporter receptor subunit TctC
MFKLIVVLMVFIWAADPSRGAYAQPGENVADFYKGKRLTFITGYTAGGSFDLITRLIARYLVKYVPGQPSALVQNMPGAGGLIATNYVYSRVPKDGTVMLNLDGGLVRLQALGAKGIDFDAQKFNWLPAPAPDLRVCWVTKASGWNSLSEAVNSSKPITLGGLTPGSAPSDTPRILKAALELNMKLVEGYKGGADMALAAHRREIDGGCFTYESTRHAFPGELKSGEIRIIAQVSEKPWPGLEDVPMAVELARTEKAKRLIRVGIIGPNDINRLFALPPDVPAARVQAIRKAFDATLKDPEFNQDMTRAGIFLRPVSVKRVEEVVASLLGMPATEREEIKTILGIDQ